MEKPVYDRYVMSEDNWAPGTTIRLATVPWDATYRDIVDFPTRAAVAEYISDRAGMMFQFNKAQTILPGFPVKVDIPYDQALHFNYLHAYNPKYTGTTWPTPDKARPDDWVNESFNRSYFYFIQDIEYCSPNSTKLYLQIDVWTTYVVGSNSYFGRCFVERGHVLMANKQQDAQQGQTFFSVPEGLETGAEMITTKMWTERLLDPNMQEAKVVVWASTLLDADGGNVDNPKLHSANGTQLEGLPNSLSLYIFESINDFNTALNGLRETPWITSGIQSCMLINVRWLGSTVTGGYCQVGGVRAFKVTASNAIGRRTELRPVQNNSDRYPDFDSVNLNQYKKLKKFRVSPYTMLEVTTETGTPILLKPELMRGPGVCITEYASVAMPSPRIAYIPWAYGRATWSDASWQVDGEENARIVAGEMFDMASWLANLPQFSVLNDGYLNTIASQAHSLAYAAESASWAQQKAIAGAELSYNQSTRGIETGLQNNLVQNRLSNQLTARSNEAAWDSSFINAGMGGLGVVGNLASGNVGGAVTGLAGVAAGIAQTGIATNAATDKTAMSVAASQQIAGNNAAAARYNRDTNREYAQWAAKGDYENAIAGINAKKQDMRLTQPTISGQQGGDNLMVSTIGLHLIVKLKQIGPAYMTMIGDYWLRYGYAIDRYVHLGNIREDADYSPYVRDGVLSLMDKFTYWKMTECKFDGDIPEQYKGTVRGIFEKGVTVWRDPEDIMQVPIFDNDVREEVRF